MHEDENKTRKYTREITRRGATTTTSTTKRLLQVNLKCEIKWETGYALMLAFPVSNEEFGGAAAELATCACARSLLLEEEEEGRRSHSRRRKDVIGI